MNQQYNPQQQYAPKAPKKPFSFDMITDYIVKFIPIISTVLCGVAVIAFLYNFIRAFVSLIQDFGFGVFMSFIANAFTSLIMYIFYAAVAAGIYKLITLRNHCRKGQEPEEAPAAQPEIPPKMVYCTQCGTRYDANKGGCPNGCKNL